MNSNNYWTDFLQGDDYALGKLYHELFESLVFVAYHRTKKMEVARDIVSELFVSILSTKFEVRKSKWENIESIHAYLTSAVKNKSIDYLRSEQAHTKILTQISADVIATEEINLEEGLRLMTTNETELFQLHLDGYSNTEIAEQKMISEKTVRNKLSMTRRKMAVIYKSFLTLALWIIVH
jgi:RNA polymerase sigma factor (sigma-70 family)